MVLDTTRRIQALERNDVDRLVEAGEGTHGLKLLRGLMKQPPDKRNEVFVCQCVTLRNESFIVNGTNKLYASKIY